MKAPISNAGASIPPEPPLPIVKEEAIIFAKAIKIRKAQGKGREGKTPNSSKLSQPYPVPKTSGNTRIRKPTITPPIAGFNSFLILSLLKAEEIDEYKYTKSIENNPIIAPNNA